MNEQQKVNSMFMDERTLSYTDIVRQELVKEGSGVKVKLGAEAQKRARDRAVKRFLNQG